MATGQLGQTDRAFATFEELETKFHHTPGIHAYNALIFAIIHGRHPRLDHVLPVLERMEVAGHPPDTMTFTYVFTLMAETNDLELFDLFYKHLMEKNIKPSRQSLRRLAIAYARISDWAHVDLLLDMMRASHSEEAKHTRHTIHAFPRYFLKRLDYFKNGGYITKNTTTAAAATNTATSNQDINSTSMNDKKLEAISNSSSKDADSEDLLGLVDADGLGSNTSINSQSEASSMSNSSSSSLSEDELLEESSWGILQNETEVAVVEVDGNNDSLEK